MTSSSLKSLGAKVVLAASSDENHPPENIIDGSTKTFWVSTGMFPQEFIIQFSELTRVSAVTMDSYNVKHLKIEKNTTQNASHFESVVENDFQSTDGHLQSNTLTLNGCSATHLRFIIASGYDHFVSVHRVTVKN
ncbi:intraflagellar transport protein 25 homolog [Gouania willdenowi]|uniref:Intraflagellar transport protein 25 homolog n=1 Tax=Gouania willdenowi TaxID=441366 RepID=A0A8C5DGA6_GOUWI|nr:intraflagellar transport protein 25 homolog [Gouania willdenowi]